MESNSSECLTNWEFKKLSEFKLELIRMLGDNTLADLKQLVRRLNIDIETRDTKNYILKKVTDFLTTPEGRGEFTFLIFFS